MKWVCLTEDMTRVISLLRIQWREDDSGNIRKGRNVLLEAQFALFVTRLFQISRVSGPLPVTVSICKQRQLAVKDVLTQGHPIKTIKIPLP